MEILTSKFLSFYMTLLSSIILFLITLKNYSEKIDDYKLQEKQVGSKQEKHDVRKLIIKYEKKATVNYIIRTLSICIIIFSFCFALLLKYLVELIHEKSIKIHTFNLDFIYSLWFIIVIIISISILFTLIVMQISRVKRYKCYIILSIITIFTICFWMSAYSLDINYCEYILSRPQIISLDKNVISGKFIINWSEVENASRYIVSVNGKKRLFITTKTEYELNNLEIMDTNQITITAMKYGCRSYQSEKYEVFYLPSINKVAIEQTCIGCDVSVILTCNGIKEEDMSIVYENVEYSWLRDGEPINNTNNKNYTLTAQDYEKNISVIVSLANQAITSNSINPELGTFSQPKIHYSKQKNKYVCLTWDYINEAKWYDFYIDNEIIVTTRLNFIYFNNEMISSDHKLTLRVRGYGYNDGEFELPKLE